MLLIESVFYATMRLLVQGGINETEKPLEKGQDGKETRNKNKKEKGEEEENRLLVWAKIPSCKVGGRIQNQQAERQTVRHTLWGDSMPFKPPVWSGQRGREGDKSSVEAAKSVV